MGKKLSSVDFNGTVKSELALSDTIKKRVSLSILTDVKTKKVNYEVEDSIDGSIFVETIEEATEMYNLLID